MQIKNAQGIQESLFDYILLKEYRFDMKFQL